MTDPAAAPDLLAPILWLLASAQVISLARRLTLALSRAARATSRGLRAQVSDAWSGTLASWRTRRAWRARTRKIRREGAERARVETAAVLAEVVRGMQIELAALRATAPITGPARDGAVPLDRDLDDALQQARIS